MTSPKYITNKEYAALLELKKLDVDFNFPMVGDAANCYIDAEWAVHSFNSDILHEKIRKCGYELDSISEREPKGLVQAKLTKYLSYDEMTPGASPIVDMIDVKGYTLRETLVVGYLKIIKDGV